MIIMEIIRDCMPERQPFIAPRRTLAMTAATGLALIAQSFLADAARAQDVARQLPPLSTPDTPQPKSEEQVAFSSDQLNYDDNTDVVTATGNVQMVRDDNRLRADKVVWDRKTGQVVASGNVSVTDPQGNIAYGDTMQVTDTLKDGVVENMLVVLQKGGRLAARKGQRKDGIYYLERATYTGCPVVDDNGCPKKPAWQIRAVRVVYNPFRQRVTYKGAQVDLFGLPLIPLPGLSNPVGEGGGNGLLVPDFRYSRVNGAEISQPYYFRLGPNRDLTVTPHLFSNALPMLEGNYRALTDEGAYQMTGYFTSSSRLPVSSTNNDVTNSRRDVRGYFDASGKFQLDPYWDISGSIRVASDRTFLRRYDISRDDRLRSNLQAERVGDNSYFSITGWAVQTLRTGDPQGQVPIALPVIDWRLRTTDPLFGGTVQFQANSLAISRTDGQDTQRAFTGAEWNLRRITAWGQEVTLTGYLRGDIYHSDHNDLTSTALYRGNPGWETRGIAAAAADMRWPFIGEAFGGTQRITPRVQIVAAPKLANLNVPNEDARAVELEDSNLFALNRFPGYDRFEDSSRVTYGLEYQLDRHDLSIDAVIGQSYRLNNRASILPEGTGLSDRLSDIVGRTTIRYRDFISLTHRYRLDKSSLAVRRNEIDTTIGSKKTYVMASYLRLNRDIANLEDLQDREELRLGGRIQFARYWSMFGSTVINLTSKADDPLSTSNGYQPVRHRLGITYSDDCFEFGLTWRREYIATGDARQGNSFLLRLAFRNLGI